MSPRRWLRFVLSALIWGVAAGAVKAGGPYSGPVPEVLPFGPGDARLDTAVTEAIDLLVVRALHCDAEGSLALRLHSMPKADPSLLRRREAAIRARLTALGVSMVLEREPLKVAAPSTADTDWDGDSEVQSPRKVTPHWHLEGSVRAGDNDFCFEDQAVHAWTDEPPRLFPWLIQLEAALQQTRGPLPSYWERLSPQVRRSSLSPSLARLAYSRAQAGNASARRVFWWLVDEEARRMRPDVRLQWVLYLWQSGSDADLQEIQRRLGVADIELDERVRRASQLMWSKLPWPVVERRLMAPGLMRRAGESLGPWLGQRDSRLNMTAAISERREWSGWSRLLRSAGAARACFVADAVWMFQPNSHSDPKPNLARLADWATGPAGYFFRESGPEHCDPTVHLLAMGAGCNDPVDTHPEVAAAWLRAGVVLNPDSVARALSPAGVWGKGECQLEPAPAGPFPYRVRKR